jgi:flagellar biosynthesis protein FlhG
MDMKTTKKRSPEIWTVGGGKGGTGKSFVLSNVGNCLALKDKKVILIDGDLGGANLHTFLGINKPKTSLTDFFEKKVPLPDLVVDSGIKNMGLLTGAIHSLSPDGIKYTQKLKLFRHIKQLDADYVLIDLGAGAHFNTIDTFLLADKMIVVIIPEVIAIENLYFFLKNAFFRHVLNSLGGHGLKNVVQNTWKNRKDHGILNFNQLIDYLKGLSKTMENIINSKLSNFKAYIVLNRINTSQEIMIGHSVKSICKKYFGLNSSYVGYIEFDAVVSRCINKRQSYMQAYPASRCAREIERLTENLLEGRDMRTKL